MYLISLLRKHPRVVISYRNSGFGDNLLAVANAWYYAKKTKRSLCIVWAPSRYMTNKKNNAFSFFFSLPESLEGVPIIIDDRIDRLSSMIISRVEYFLPFPAIFLFLHGSLPYSLRLRIIDKHSIKYRNKRRKAVEDTIKKLKNVTQRCLITNSCYNTRLFGSSAPLRPFFYSLKLKPEFQKNVDGFAEKYFKNRKVIGVHIRYYNEKMPKHYYAEYWADPAQALKVCLLKIEQAVAKLRGLDHVVFLCTDSRLVQTFITNNVDNIVVYDKKFGSDSSKELHSEMPVETAAATITEMFLLAKSDILVRFPPRSWFSFFASLYVKEIID